MDLKQAEKWLTQLVLDYCAFLPQSAKGPVEAVGRECIAALASRPVEPLPEEQG